MKYVISDIHGQYDKFIEMLKLINFNENDTLYILGDVIDRGRKSIKALQYIMSQDNMIMLLGNHEEFMLEYYNGDGENRHYWAINGGNNTFDEIQNIGNDELDKILSYLKSLDLYKTIEVNNNIFHLCHAGLEFKNGLFKEQYRDYVLWSRDAFIYQDLQMLKENEFVVFGHTPTITINGKDEIWKNNHKIGIDCGSIFGYKLACLRLDDMKEFYI